MGLRDEVFLMSLDFHVAKMSSFICIISASVALKSSKESRQRDSLCILYAISHSTLRVRGLSLMYSHTVGQPGHRAQLIRLWEMLWASVSMTHTSRSESLLLIQWVWALLEVHSSTRAHMKSCITKSFKWGWSSLSIHLTTFSIISHQWILFLDGLPSIRTQGSKLPPCTLCCSARASRVP